jgi:UDP-N-acetylmuramoyl-tripeptide--D-alanyl-D-alanine ligase
LGPLLLSDIPAAVAPPGPTDWGSDSRSITPKTWFVPIKGETYDGNDFIEAAMKAGAAGFLYDQAAAGKVPADLKSRGIMVTDGLQAYQAIAAGWRSTLTGTKIAAITGSVGKTTTKEMIGFIFRHAGPCFSTAGSFNNEIGVPKSLLQISREHKYAMLEFGAKRLGNIRFLCEMAKPDVTILLNVGVAHLGIFGSLENLRNTKLEIFRNSPAHAVLVANHDDPKILAGARETGKKVISFGRDPAATVAVRQTELRPELGGTDMQIAYAGRIFSFMLNSCHSAFVTNAAAALAAAVAAGIPMETAVEGLKSFEPVAGRFRVVKGKNLIVIDDTYNANPDSMKAGLSSVFSMFPGKKINLMLGDMLELGSDSPKMHEEIGHFLQTFPVHRLATVGTEAHLIHDGIGKRPDAGLRFGNVREATEQAAAVLDGADVLFIKGSNGIRLTQFISHLQSTGALS